MKILKNILLLFTLTVFLISCGDSDDNMDVDPTCSDSIQNQDETGIDCGGVCAPCPTCTDGIQNQNETGIDCGGACAPCSTSTCTDGIQNQDETGIDCGGVCAPCSTSPTCADGILNGDETGIDCGGSCDPCDVAFSEHITCLINDATFEANLVLGFDDLTTLEFQSDQSQERQLFFVLPSGIAEGTYELVNNPGFSAEYKELFGGEYTTESGSITVTNNNTAEAELSGSFEFTAVAYEFGTPVDTVVVTDGSFGVEYF